MRKIILSMLFVLMSAGISSAAIHTEEVNYVAGDFKLKGYIAYDDAVEKKRPAVIVVHEWWGQNDYVRRRAEMLAELGYVGFAIDMYGNGKAADHPKEAGEFMNSVMNLQDLGASRFKAAEDLIRNHPMVNAKKIAAIGYCFGGATVLNMARMGADLKGVVSFHGSLASTYRAQPDGVKAKVLVCHGADDKFISPEAIEDFKKEMEDADADYEFRSYEGAVHGFTNSEATANGEKFGIPIAYNEAADKQSWDDMKSFLKSIF